MTNLEPNSGLPLAPTIASLPINDGAKNFFSSYATRTKPWGGIGIITGTDEKLVNDVFYAVLAKMCEQEIKLLVADHKASYLLPQPPDNYPGVKPEDIKTAMDALEIASYRTSALIYNTSEEYSYEKMLGSFSRWDPDVIASGSLTAEGVPVLCINLSLSGHRVPVRTEMATVSQVLEYLLTLNEEWLGEALDFIAVVSPEKVEVLSLTPELRTLFKEGNKEKILATVPTAL